MARAEIREKVGALGRDYRRGAIMGMTMAEAFILIAFALLLLLGAWKMKADEDAERMQAVSEVSREDIAALSKIAQSGADLDRMVQVAEEEKKWRLIDSDELRRTVDAVEKMPDDMQKDLADMVEFEKTDMLLKILETTKRAPEDTQLEDRLASIGRNLNAARTAERAMIADLRDTLDVTVTKIGGHIDEDGAIVLPDTVLFGSGEASITPRMLEFLEAACEPWLEVLMRSPAKVSGAQIEGHASSEWRSDTTPDQAYLNNLDLSQRRSQTVLRACLGIVQDQEIKSWAHKHLAAVGYSSGRVVRDDAGEEDPYRSRRVVFRAAIDTTTLIETVETDVGEGLIKADK